MTPHNKVAMVTGAGTGIGQAAALALGRNGFELVLAGRRKEHLDETAALLDSPRTLVIPTDIGDPDQITMLFSRVRETFGRLDVLFNNAGIGAPRIPMEDLRIEDWKRAVDVNLTGSFLCAREAIRIMKEQTPRGGRIINNGSISAHTPRPDTVAYTATKHAITGLTRSIALDGRKNDIACSQIDIGNADTPLAGRMKHGVPQANGDIMAEPVMDAAHCGEMVARIATLPPDVNVLFTTIMATKMPYVGRG